MRVKNLIKFFPKRNKATIAAKAMNLGLLSAKTWQNTDNKLLCSRFANSSKKELLSLFPRRTWPAILAQGERLGIKRNRNKPRLNINENYFSKWSPNMAYILGFILADGCIIKGTYKGYSDSLKFGVQLKDKDILEKIKIELRSGHRISIIRNAAHLCITSQKIVDSLKHLGITYQKSLNEIVPDVPDKYKRDFVRGVIDGDGGISFDKRSYPTLALCGGKNTVSFVRDYFWIKQRAFSVVGKRKFSPKINKYLYGITYRANTAKKISLFLYKNTALYLDRKYKLALRCQNIQIRQRINSSLYEKWQASHSG